MSKQKRIGFYLFMSVALLIAGLAAGVQALDFSAVPGTVLDYHELTYDFGYKTAREIVSDPCIVVLSNGNYIAGHSMTGRESTANVSGQTSLFLSSDHGQSWSPLGTLGDIFTASIVEYNGAVWLIGTTKNGGVTSIYRSQNGGTNWTKSAAFSIAGHYTPDCPVVYNNRLWTAANLQTFSALQNQDLLLESSWTKTGGMPASQTGWLTGTAGIEEGQIVGVPGLGLFLMPRVNDYPYSPFSRVDPVSGAVCFDPDHNYARLPGGEKKFGAKYDAGSGKIFVVSNPVLPAYPGSELPNMIRNTGAILSSRDMINWKVEKLYVFSSNWDTEGFGYANLDFDGNDMVLATRTAFPVPGETSPTRGHDSNILGFFKVSNFRNLIPDQYLKIEGNLVKRYERTQYQDAPLGVFELGVALNSPSRLGQDSSGDVYIQDSNGIRHFDASGNFLQTTNASPVSLQSAPLTVAQPNDGSCTWIKTGSGDWSDPLNWYYWNRPDTSEDIAVFGSAATAPTAIDIPSDSREWLFNTAGNLDGWTTLNMTNIIVSGGTFQATPSTINPAMTRANQSFYGDDVPTVTIRMRAAIGSTTLQFYWGTAVSNSIAEARVVSAIYTGNGEFQDVVFSPSGHAQWDGQIIKQIRIDPVNGSLAALEVDSITVKKESTRIKGLRFRNANSYTLSGGGQLQIENGGGNGTVEVLQGRHTNNVALILGSDTDMSLAANTSLYLKQGIDLNGKTLHVAGSGRLLIQGALVMRGGEVTVNGNTPLTFTNNLTGALLDGKLQFLPEGAFSPSGGSSFDLLDNQSLLGTNRFAAVILPSLSEGLQWNTNTLYSAGNVSVEPIPRLALPFIETFERFAAGASIIVPGNTNGWYSGTNTITAIVTNLSYGWTNILHPVEGVTHTNVLQYTDAGLSVRFETNTSPVNKTVDFMASNFSSSLGAEPDMSLVEGSQTAFYADSSGYLNVWYGLDSTGTNNAWVTCTNISLGTAEWARVTIVFDYTTDTVNGHSFFKVALNGIELKPVTNGYSKGPSSFSADPNGIWLLAANPAPRSVQDFMMNGSGLLDDLVVTTNAVTGFFPPAYTLTGIVAGGNGAISPASTNVTAGSNAAFLITASNYYRISSLTANGTSVVLPFDNNSISTNFIWSNVQSAGTLAATFTAQITSDPANTPYEWLAQYGLTNFNADAETDADGDGILTWQEYIAGTNPTKPASVFKITGGNVNPQGGAIIRWSSVSNRIYNLSRTTNLMEAFTAVAGASNLLATPPENVYTNSSPDGGSAFYKISVHE